MITAPQALDVNCLHDRLKQYYPLSQRTQSQGTQGTRTRCGWGVGGRWRVVVGLCVRVENGKKMEQKAVCQEWDKQRKVSGKQMSEEKMKKTTRKTKQKNRSEKFWSYSRLMK